MKYKDYLSPVSLNQSTSFNNFFHLFICKEKKDMNQTKLKSREPRWCWRNFAQKIICIKKAKLISWSDLKKKRHNQFI